MPTRRKVRLKLIDVYIGHLLYPETVDRPKVRGECPTVRPCPFVGCKYNLYLEAGEGPSDILYTPEHEPWDHPPQHSCVLDSADRGAMTLEEIAVVMGVSRERVRQVEESALAKLSTAVPYAAHRDVWAGPDDSPAKGPKCK